MSIFFEQIVNSILLGSSYTLVAIGFTLFFGVINAIVFCSGDIAVVGAFAVMSLTALAVSLGLFVTMPFWLAALLVIVLSALICGLFGVITHRLTIKPFDNSPVLMPLLSTIALGIIIKELIGLFYPQGRNPQVFPKLLPEGHILGNGVLSYQNLIMVGVTIIILIGLFWFVNKTKLGLSMQAVEQYREAALMIGVNLTLVVTLTFIIGGFLLGIGGFLIGTYYGVIRFDLGVMYGLKGFSAAVVGGLGSIYGAIVGGMLLGFVEVFVAGYVPGGNAYADVISFLVVVLFMIFRPEGILGTKTVEKV